MKRPEKFASAHGQRLCMSGLVALTLCSIALGGCYYLKGPKDRTSESRFDSVRDQCIELDRRAYLIKSYRDGWSPYDQELRFAESSLVSALGGVPPDGGKEALARKGIRVVRTCEVGTVFRMVKFIEIYPGLGPRVITIMRERDGSGPDISLGEFQLLGFPEDDAVPFGGRVIPCDGGATAPGE